MPNSGLSQDKKVQTNFPEFNFQESNHLDNRSKHLPIHEVIENYASQQATAIAIRFQDQSLTYAELNHKANQLAHYLLSLGVGSEVRVGVFVKPSLEIGVALLSIFKIGGVYVPLDHNYPQERLATILEDNQPQIILTQSDLLSQLPESNIPVFCCDRDFHQIARLSTQNPISNTNFNLDQTAYIIYTSGTTGKPKGVMVSYRNLQHYIFVAQQKYAFDRDTIMCAIARFSFSITFFELLSPLVSGGTLVILEREHILDFRQMCQTLEQINTIHASPNLLKKIFSHIEDNGIDIAKFRGLRHVSTGGDLAPINVLESMRRIFSNAEIYVIYGCSEVSCMACSYFVSGEVPRDQPIPKSLVGKPFTDVTVRLYDPDQNLVPINTIGEVYISGAGISKGYLHQPELTAEKFITINQQRFYRTGDHGRFDVNGNLELLGRTDFQIKLNGIRIEPSEIETVLRQISGVRESVVVMRELSSGELGIVAYLVLNSTNPPQINDIRRLLQSQLPDYMVPSSFVILDALPLTLNGKIDRNALPKPEFIRQETENSFVAPRNELEIKLTQIWEKILGIPKIGIRDNFFELGGSSFAAVRLFTDIEKQFGKNFPLSTLFQIQTIEAFAKILAQEEWTASWSSLVPIQPKGSKTPLFVIHAVGGNVLDYSDLARCFGEDRPVYGLQSVGLDGKQEPLTTVADMASYYLKEIRIIQPQGPYLLFGYSFGGVIAFEMAQQLYAQGDKIGFLGVCDLDSPNTFRESELSLSSSLKVHFRNISQTKGISAKLQYLQDRLSYRSIYKIYKNYMNQEFSKIEATPPEFLLKLFSTNSQSHKDYTAKIYPGSLTLFRCKIQSIDHYSNPDLGWDKIIGEKVNIHYISGSHFELMKPPKVSAIAKEIDRYLKDVER